MNRKKGFTLIELITVIAILSVLTGVLIPQVSGVIGTSKDSVCLNNLATLNRIYRQQVALDENLKPEEVIINLDGKYYAGVAQCPSGVKYQVKNNTIICPNHKTESEGSTVDLPMYEDMLKKQLEIEKCLALPSGSSECIKDLYGTFYFSNDKFCEYYYAKNGNKWDLIDKELARKAGLQGDTNYYIRPFFTETKVPMLFASTSSNVKGSWNADMIYYGGTWHKLNNTIQMTLLRDMSQEQIEKYITENSAIVK
ncbi:MAG: type II secretion system protein [Anaerorhabdus sp.]